MSQLAQRLIMAAGGGKKDSTYVDDVFSTYLYKGNGATDGDSQAIDNGIKLSNANVGNSVNFDGSGDYLSIPDSTAWDIGTNYTAECFFYIDRIMGAGWDAIFGQWPGSNNAATNTWVLEYVGASTLYFYYNNGSQSMLNVSLGNVSRGAWHHFAFSKEGSNTRLFIDGNLTQTITPTYWNGTGSFNIGGNVAGGGWINGNVSNVRITKDQALYTSNFTPTTEALTTTSQGAIESNVKLLCCNKDTVTGSTVTPGTITANGSDGNGPTPTGFGPFQTGEDAKGGMVWMKSRDNGYWHSMVDTERGANKTVYSNSSWQEETLTNLLNSFNNSGFIPAYNSSYSAVFANKNNDNYASWTFAKQEGFFDVVTWTGNNTAGRQLPHNLGSRPGMVAIKCTSHNHNWTVWHRDLSSNAKTMTLNDNAAEFTNDAFNGAAPTSSVIHLSSTNASNAAGKTYVAYLWAGGSSTAATARSVDFDGNDDQLNIPDSTDWDLGNGDFTLETWIKSTQTTAGYYTALGQWTTHSSPDYGWAIRYASQDIGTGWSFFYSTNGSNYITTMGSDISDGQWHHIAITRTGGNLRTFTDGILNTTRATTDTFNTSGATMKLGGQTSVGNHFDGQLSNVRLVKGTALYTSSFRPPTEPLTNVTNTKLLCCNNSSVTGSTVTPGTITTSGSPIASTYSPFDDPEGFKFGEGGDQNIIKTGSFIGGGSVARDVNIGWEPQWVLIKNASAVENWFMFDNMRGVASDGNDNRLQADTDGSEFTTFDYIEFNSTGFKVNANATAGVNGSGNTMTFVAIRRPDGYVGKPAEAGNEVFDMDNPGDIFGPSFESSTVNVVDFALMRILSGSNTFAPARLTQGSRVKTNSTDASASFASTYNWDYQNGWSDFSQGSGYMSWMWKRHAGFDVVTDKGDGQTTKTIAHGLGRVPEMIWRKNRDGGSDNWQVYHIGLNGGTNPYLWRMYLNTTNTESEDQWTWTNAPTATHFTVGANGAVNRNNEDFITMLFASVEGISKLGYYDGTGSAGHVITTGFLPRLLIIRTVNANNSWFMYDSVRGLGAGNDPYLQLENTNAQAGGDTFATSSTGFTINQSYSSVNASGQKYIYYAHA